jgi:hypothetical protein
VEEVEKRCTQLSAAAGLRRTDHDSRASNGLRKSYGRSPRLQRELSPGPPSALSPHLAPVGPYLLHHSSPSAKSSPGSSSGDSPNSSLILSAVFWIALCTSL